MDFVVVDADEDYPVGAEQFAQEFEPGRHHTEPFVVAGEVVSIDGLPEPILHQRAVDIVVIFPTFVAGVVGRVNVDALDLAGVGREQRFQSVQIVAVDDEVVVQGHPIGQAFILARNQLPVRHGEVMILDEGFSFKL